MYGTFTARNVIGEQHESREKSTTPSEMPWNSVSFFPVLFLTEPKPGFARQKKQDNKKRRLEKSGTYTARNVIQEQN